MTADLIAAKLRKEYDIYLPEGYDTWIQEVIRPDSGLYSEKRDAVILLLDGTEARNWKNAAEAQERLDLWKQAAAALAGNMPDIPVFLPTLDLRESRIRALSERKHHIEWAADWYAFAQELADKHPSVYIYDLADRIAETGRSRFYSDKMWYLSSMPYSRDGILAVTEELTGILGSAFKPRRKIAVLDLDNTLWGGVIGEDGVEGIELSDHKEGQRYYDFQSRLKEMQTRGTVLAIDSKNNEDDAMRAIREHPDMVLREADFVAARINWQDKASNLKSIGEELNLTEGSFVFIDDNPIEREIVSGECPDAEVPSFPEDTTELNTFAEKLYVRCFRPLRLLKEDTEKTAMYRTEAKRKALESVSLNLDDYISKLEIEADIHRMKPEELDRTAQLIGKTNQFNLTTKRYTAAEIADMASDPACRIYTVHAKDKYGDSGLVSVLILKDRDDGQTAGIDTFLMSCRVMGRKLEQVIIDRIAASCRERGILKMTGAYIPTAKNAPVKGLYGSLGFREEKDSQEEKDIESGSGRRTDDAPETGIKHYSLPIPDYREKSFDSYKSVHFEP